MPLRLRTSCVILLIPPGLRKTIHRTCMVKLGIWRSLGVRQRACARARSRARVRPWLGSEAGGRSRALADQKPNESWFEHNAGKLDFFFQRTVRLEKA